MSRLLLPLLILLGAGSGLAAGWMLRPAPAEVQQSADCAAQPLNSHDATPPNEAPPSDQTLEYVKLNNQFVVPVVRNERVTSLVVLSITLEVTQGTREQIYQREPKLRDAFLRVLFDHANNGGFDGTFTSGNNMTVLRDGLLEVAKVILGPLVSDVLIVDIVRQDA